MAIRQQTSSTPQPKETGWPKMPVFPETFTRDKMDDYRRQMAQWERDFQEVLNRRHRDPL